MPSFSCLVFLLVVLSQIKDKMRSLACVSLMFDALKAPSNLLYAVYKDLPHPPATYVGDKYRFRSADGGENNIEQPDLGRFNSMILLG